jgi:hypothetical protein
MSCTPTVLPELNGCSTRPVKGIKSISVIKRSDVASVYSRDANIPSDGDLVLSGVKDWVNVKTSEVVSENMPSGFKHTIEILNTLVLTDADKKLLDEADDLVFCVENYQGELLAYGATYGLWKTKQDRDLNANSGQISLTFESRTGIEEPVSDYTWKSV